MTDPFALSGHVSLDDIGKGLAYVLGPGEGVQSLANNTLRTQLARADDTNGDFGLLMCSGDESLPTIPHFHRHTTEAMFVMDGAIRVWLDDQHGTRFVRVLEAGEFGLLPRNWIHAWAFAAPNSRQLGIMAPGGFERIVDFLNPNEPPSLERLRESEKHIDVKWLPEYALFDDIDESSADPAAR